QQTHVLGFVWEELAKDTSQPDSLRAQIGSNKVVSRRGDVAFVEDQVNDRLNGCKTPGQSIGRRHLVGNACSFNLAFCPDDTLSDRGFRDEKRLCDFGDCQSTKRL